MSVGITPSVGVALVTHNSEHFLIEVLTSIAQQTLPIAQIRIVDDASTDKTAVILTRWCQDMNRQGIDAQVLAATSTDPDPLTRTAQNFAQAVRASAACDLVALADHDDTWLPHRIHTQVAVMDQHPDAVLLASNGNVILSSGPRTLFEAFAVPSDLNDRSCEEIARTVIRQSVATGSASMIRPRHLTRLPNFGPPRGWLHDRWWSILAASRCGLRVDGKPVIDYRVDPEQQVGLDRGRQTTTGVARASTVRSGDLVKLRELLSLRALASPEVRSAFSAWSLLRTLTSRSAR